jgi:hypothetical protein
MTRTNNRVAYQTPKTQEEADAYYQQLDHMMCDEVIWRDGEATYNEARDEFNLHLQTAKRIKKESGFLPTISSDVFFFGIPKEMPKRKKSIGEIMRLKYKMEAKKN